MRSGVPARWLSGIVHSHGGGICAENKGSGEGTRFGFTLLAVEGTAVYIVPRAVIATTGSVQGRELRVLAVDDNPRALRHVRDIPTSVGLKLVVAVKAGEILLETEFGCPPALTSS